MTNSNNTQSPEISIVVPCYNEEENVLILWRSLHEVMDALGRDYELLFVNDGSADGTEAVLTGLKTQDARMRVIRLKKNSGLSSALLAGFQSARGEYIVTLDADLQNDPQDIPQLLAYLPEYDMAFGWRKDRKDNIIRVLSTKIANGVRNYLTQENIPDIACTLKAFKRSCLNSIKMYKGMHRFLPTLFHIEGYRTIQIPVRHHHRQFGQAKYGVWNRLFVSTADCFAVRWMIRRRIQFEKEEIE
ncbi:MAG: glycosyltransferase family 2 protein [Candidatus Omnitrophota bacterium]